MRKVLSQGCSSPDSLPVGCEEDNSHRIVDLDRFSNSIGPHIYQLVIISVFHRIQAGVHPSLVV